MVQHISDHVGIGADGIGNRRIRVGENLFCLRIFSKRRQGNNRYINPLFIVALADEGTVFADGTGEITRGRAVFGENNGA